MIELIQCPYCGEPCELADVDEAETGTQDFIQDCDVCCQPISIRVVVRADGEISVRAVADQ